MGNTRVLNNTRCGFVLYLVDLARNLQAYEQTKHGSHVYDHRDSSASILKCDCQIKGNCKSQHNVGIIVKTA